MIRMLLCVLCCIAVPNVARSDEGATTNRHTTRSFIFLWAGQSESDAQLNLDDPIVTERPSFTDSSSTVGRGVLQAEMGYTYSYNGATSPHEASHAYPELLLRGGVAADWFELRVGQSAVTFDQPGNSSTGFADLYLGVKLGIVPQLGVLPQLSIIPQMTLPSGASDLRADGVLSGVNVVYSWSISPDSSLGATTQANQRAVGNGADVYTSFAQSLVASTRWDRSWGSYIEWYALFPDSTVGGDDSHYADTGVTYLLSKNFQLDLRFGTRLQARFGEEIFTGLGMSVRQL